MKVSAILLCMVCLTISSISAYKILSLHHIPSISHHMLARGMVRSLLKAGHEVTWVTPYLDEKKHENLTVIDISSILGEIGSLDTSGQNFQGFSWIKEMTRNISLANLHHPAVREVLIKEQYDAVVSEWFLSDMEAGFAAIQQVPWILLSSIIIHPHLEYLVDTVRSVSTVPMMMTNFPVPMNFKQRLINTIIYGFMSVDSWWDSSKTEALYQSSFRPLAEARGVPLPPFSEALHNISILFVNSHPSFALPRSLPPNVVDIAGFHIEEDVPALPQDLQDILDKSTKGAIYFSMGSLLKSSSFSPKTRRDLIKLLAKLPLTVLWKYEEDIKDLPKNIHVRKWMPQTSILAHKNVKIFITHAGLLSTLEAIHFGVPMLAIPVFGDQTLNADAAVRAGRAVKVDFSEEMVPKIQEALQTLMANDSYSNTAKHLSKLFRTRVVPPSKLIPFYIELAIESKGAYHLRSPALLYKWYERNNIDQMAALCLLLFIIYFLSRIIFTKIKNCFKKEFLSNNNKKNK